MIANPFDSIIITFYWFQINSSVNFWINAFNCRTCTIKSFMMLNLVLSSGQVGCRRSSILQVSMSEIDLPSTPSDEVISQTQSFSIFDVSQSFISYESLLSFGKSMIHYRWVMQGNNPESVQKFSNKSKSFHVWYHRRSFGILFHVQVFQNCILIDWWRSNFCRISLWDFKNFSSEIASEISILENSPQQQFACGQLTLWILQQC